MKKGCVSVIVPVYNQRQCIEKCLNSIINQTYHNLQILVIDDGSNDGTDKLLDQYARKDSRIEVYHVENKGVSESRNYALCRVKGEYIQFVDADDEIKDNMTYTMVQAMLQNDVDMVICNYVKQFSKLFIYNMLLEKPKKYTSKNYLIGTLKDPGHHYYGVVWNKLYKAEIVLSHKMLFDKKVTLGEDFIFNINYWLSSSNVLVLSNYLYIYNKTSEYSLSNKKNKSIDDCISEMQNRKKIFAVYSKVIKTLVRTDEYFTRLYQYWLVFYIRQDYGFKHEYSLWSSNDRERWEVILNQDEDINKAFEIASDKWINQYKKKYRINSFIKNTAKKILKIS